MNEVTSIQPRQRTIVAWDVEGSTTRTNMARAALREDMYHVVEAALLACKITEDLREPFEDRGDGGIVLIRPVDRLPKPMFLQTFVPLLNDMLDEHGYTNPDRSFRLRVAIHSGEVLFDRNGFFGEDVDITCRLLNAPKLKRRLQMSAASLTTSTERWSGTATRASTNAPSSRSSRWSSPTSSTGAGCRSRPKPWTSRS
jgi:hypothetical protein